MNVKRLMISFIYSVLNIYIICKRKRYSDILWCKERIHLSGINNVIQGILHPNDVLIVHLLIKKQFYDGLTINFTSWNFSIGYIIF